MIAIIGILIALLLPAVQAAREAARRSQCTNNEKQIALAMHNYHSAKRKLPYGSAYFDSRTLASLPRRGPTAYAAILPFIEEQGIYSLFDFNYRMSEPQNSMAVTNPVAVYTCPSDPAAERPILEKRGGSPQFGGSNNPNSVQGNWYPICAGPVGDTSDSVHNAQACHYCPKAGGAPADWCCQGKAYGNYDGQFPGMFARGPIAVSFKQVTDGLSKTIMLGETLPAHCVFNGVYSTNFNISCNHIPINIMETDNGDDSANAANRKWTRTSGYKSMHVGGANLAMGDGSVRFVSEGIDYRLYVGLGTRAGGETGSIP